MDSEFPEEFEVKVRMHGGSVLSHFLFAVVVDVVTEFARKGVLRELLYVDDLVLMGEKIEGLILYMRARICKLTLGIPR